MSKPKQPVTPKLSATVLLLRDSADSLEVFMVERHHQIDFATGALVFPGGKVDPADATNEVHATCRGLDGLPPDEATARVAAVRETFEESGVLLARRRGEEALVSGQHLAEIESRHRDRLQEDQSTILDMIESENLELACDLLVPFAHWITPEFMKKRFDTHFFLVAAPPGQLALHDGVESVDSTWTTVAAALAAGADGSRTVIFPTRMNLQKLGEAGDIESAFRQSRARARVTVLPQLSRDEEGNSVILIPEEAGYGISVVSLDDIMH